MLAPDKSKNEKIDSFELPNCSPIEFVAPHRPPDPGFSAPFARYPQLLQLHLPP